VRDAMCALEIRDLIQEKTIADTRSVVEAKWVSYNSCARSRSAAGSGDKTNYAVTRMLGQK